jgi:hypothetical protein
VDEGTSVAAILPPARGARVTAPPYADFI